MKTLIAAVLMTSLTAFAADKAQKTTYKVDTQKTKVMWEGTKVTGKHNGTVPVKSGNLEFTGGDLTGGEIVVDMNGMTVDDLAADKEMTAKFLGHMKSPDFFDTAKYPESKLAIKSTKKSGNDLEVTGDLTMLGKTNPVTFKVTDWKWTENMVTGKANMKVNRTKFGLKYGSGSFFKGLGDKMIHDDFTLNIDLTATR